MNIETLNSYILDFENQVVQSGFFRDITDYEVSLNSNQNNIVSLRTIANNVLSSYTEIMSGDLVESLPKLLVKESSTPFTQSKAYTELQELISDKEIGQSKFFTSLQQTLNLLRQNLNQNLQEITGIKEFITPYILEERQELEKSDKTLISIIFKDQKTITNLKEFVKNLAAWNKILTIYQPILKSDSPEDIEIATVQNG